MRRGVFVIGLIVAAACAAHGQDESAPWLPSGFIGHWGGVPTYTSSGPKLASSGGINFTIHPINDHYWMMEDSVGRTVEMKNSQQQFWISGAATNGSSSVQSELGIMSYCGWLTGYYKTMPQHGLVMVTKITRKTNRSLTFTYTKDLQYDARLYMPWTVEMWMDLWDDNKTMTLTVTLPNGPEYRVHHLMVNLTLLDRNPWGHLSEKAQDYVKNDVGPTVCNFTAVPSPMPPAGIAEADETDVRRLCPHGFTERDGPMPDFVKKQIEAKQVSEARVAMNQKLAAMVKENWQHMGHEAVARVQEQLYPIPSTKPHVEQQYQYCAMLSSYNNVTLQTTWDTETQSVHAMVSARVKVRPASQSWVAVGIMPAWPSMFGMDVILGYLGRDNMTQQVPRTCTRSMYAQHNAWTPTDYAGQNITNGNVFTTEGDEVINFQFTRPWQTGMWDLTTGPVFNSSYKFIPIPIVAWAIGEAPDLCSEDPKYHHEFRGTHGWSWLAPQTAVTDLQWCKGWTNFGRI